MSGEENCPISSGYNSQADEAEEKLVKVEPEEGVGEDSKDIFNLLVFLGDSCEDMGVADFGTESKAENCGRKPTVAN